MKNPAILLLLLLQNCEPTSCRDIDHKFVSTFEDHLRTIKKTETSNVNPIEPLTNAYQYMNAVTGIHARINDFDTPHYNDHREYFEDVEKWEQWLEKNRCSMTFERADSLYRMYSGGEFN